jgi:hypothetical protein
MAGAFQAGAFQANAFQVDAGSAGDAFQACAFQYPGFQTSTCPVVVEPPPATGGGGGGAEPSHLRRRREEGRRRVLKPKYRVLSHEEIYGPQQPKRIKALRAETAPAALLLGSAEAALPRFDATSLQALRDTASPDLIEAIKAAAMAAAATAAEQEQKRREEQERIAAEVARIQAEAQAAAAEILAADDAEAIALIMQVEEEVVQAFLEAISSLVLA